VCPGIPNAFSLDTSTSILGLVDSSCTLDYIGIPSKLFKATLKDLLNSVLVCRF